MNFNFYAGNKVDTRKWFEINNKLLKDLRKLADGKTSEEEVDAYLKDMVNSLQRVKGNGGEVMLFLMFDKPSSMPADARVEYVYKPTYIAATIMMTAMNRYAGIDSNKEYKSILVHLLEGASGRGFVGSGYELHTGLMNTLEIFFIGDTLEFVNRYPDLNKKFTNLLWEKISFVETEICSGVIRNDWTGDHYIERGNQVLSMIKDKTLVKERYVWYACYGSNISYNRFMRYIERCTDVTPPSKSRPYIFNHSIYFSKSTAKWDNGGKAFLDNTAPGMALGRIYKITEKQFKQIKDMEGPDYRKELHIEDIDGLPVITFTDIHRNTVFTVPSYRYFNEILKGLMETYGEISTPDALRIYLINTIFPEDVFEVVKMIKNSPRYVSIDALAGLTCKNIRTVKKTVKWLVEHDVIKQDTRSINAGHSISNPEAYFYTVDSPCARTLIAAMLED